jgi:hypothetical protein
MRNFTKLRPVEVALFHEDRGMDKYDKANSRSRTVFARPIKMKQPALSMQPNADTNAFVIECDITL